MKKTNGSLCVRLYRIRPVGDSTGNGLRHLPTDQIKGPSKFSGALNPSLLSILK